MKFVLFLSCLPGKYLDAVKIFKHYTAPESVKIEHFLGLFGKPDAMVIFEAPDEKTASEFSIQFGNVAEIKTVLAQPIEAFRWTQ